MASSLHWLWAHPAEGLYKKEYLMHLEPGYDDICQNAGTAFLSSNVTTLTRLGNIYIQNALYVRSNLKAFVQKKG